MKPDALCFDCYHLLRSLFLSFHSSFASSLAPLHPPSLSPPYRLSSRFSPRFPLWEGGSPLKTVLNGRLSGNRRRPAPVKAAATAWHRVRSRPAARVGKARLKLRRGHGAVGRTRSQAELTVTSNFIHISRLPLTAGWAPAGPSDAARAVAFSWSTPEAAGRSLRLAARSRLVSLVG